MAEERRLRGAKELPTCDDAGRLTATRPALCTAARFKKAPLRALTSVGHGQDAGALVAQPAGQHRGVSRQ